mgnify:CR=1 FL=1
MSIVSQAVGHYHELLSQRAGSAADMLAAVYAEQERRGVVYATRAIPTMLRPQFISGKQDALLEYSLAVLARALEKVIKLYAEEEYVRAAIPFPADAVPYFMKPTGLRRNLMIARFDAFLQGSDLKYIEFNTDSPASVVWNEVHQEVFDELSVMQEFRTKYRLRTLEPRRMLQEALLEAHRDFGLSEAPSLAIVDWRDVATWPEFELAKAWFDANGLPTVLADPRELEVRNGALWAGDTKINLVYRRVIWRELLNRKTDCQPLFDAVDQGLACVANPFRAKVAGNKAMLSFLRNPDHAHLFDAEENAVIERHIPWTAVLRHRPVRFEGRRADPFDLAVADKDGFVLKPLNAYGGRGVLMGDEASQTDWEQALAEAEGGGWCLQRRVNIPEAEFPVMEGGLHFEPRKINLNPFSIGGQYGGCLTRVSTNSIINVTAGGGMIPTYAVLED